MHKYISVCRPPSSTLQFPSSVLNLLSSVLILYFPYFFIRSSSFNLSLFVQLSVCRPSSSVLHLSLFHPPSFVLCPLSSVLRPSSFLYFVSSGIRPIILHPPSPQTIRCFKQLRTLTRGQDKPRENQISLIKSQNKIQILRISRNGKKYK